MSSISCSRLPLDVSRVQAAFVLEQIVGSFKRKANCVEFKRVELTALAATISSKRYRHNVKAESENRVNQIGGFICKMSGICF